MPNEFNTMHLPNGGCNLNIAEILDLISAKFKEHVKFQDESDADALALWVAMTYVMDHLEIAPMLYITSPVAQCGKSTVLKLLSAFCNNSRMVSKSQRRSSLKCLATLGSNQPNEARQTSSMLLTLKMPLNAT